MIKKYKVLKIKPSGEEVLSRECYLIPEATKEASVLAQKLKGNEEYEKVQIKELIHEKYEDVGEIYIEQKKGEIKMKEYKLNEREIKWLKENDIFEDLKYISVDKETNKYYPENEFVIDFWDYKPEFKDGTYDRWYEHRSQFLALDGIDVDISESEQIFLGLREVGLYKVDKGE